MFIPRFLIKEEPLKGKNKQNSLTTKSPTRQSLALEYTNPSMTLEVQEILWDKENKNRRTNKQ